MLSIYQADLVDCSSGMMEFGIWTPVEIKRPKSLKQVVPVTQ